LGMDDSQPINSKMVSRTVESAQKRVEGNDFDTRKTILSFDDVLREQREIIYKQRFEVIDDEENVRDITEQLIKNTENMVVETHTKDNDEENCDNKANVDYLQGNMREKDNVSLENLQGTE